ncbi:MAG: gliding motility-associated C-terminal domain-containing protein [Saprospiraceae bacterium]
MFYRSLLIFGFTLGIFFPNGLYAGHDTLYICRGESVQLAADPGFATYRWLPELGLDNPTIPDPMAVPPVTTTYIVESIPAVGQNQINNGDFSEGNFGFTSDYTYSPGANPTQGVYGVFPDANNLSPMYFEHCRDHTTGDSGLMMVVDGSPVAGQKVWCKRLLTDPNTTYAFTTWLTSILQPNPAALRFSINGVQIGATFVASTENCQWRQFYELWESGEATEAEICIVNQNTNPNGNDFALDDFGFFEIGEVVYDTFTVVVHDIPVVQLDTTFCEGEVIDYQGQLIPVSPAFNLTYTSQYGCDSMVQYRAEIVDTVTIVNRVDTLCPGDTYQFYNHLIDRDTLICETISSPNGCDTTICLQAVYLTETALKTTATPPACYGGQNGNIRLAVEAGLPPFQYRWEDGSTQEDRINLGAGSYRIEVTDAKGCRAAKTINLGEPPPLSADAPATSTLCNGSIDGRIRIAATGGTMPYLFSVDGGQSFVTNSLFSGLQPGPYRVLVQDGNECVFSLTTTVPEALTMRLNVPEDSRIRLGESLAVLITDNAPEQLSYEWIPADGVVCPTCAKTEVRPFSTTRYRIVAMDAQGCSVSAEWLVEVSRESSVYIPNAFSPNGDGVNDSFRLFTGLGVSGILEFSIYDRWGNLLFHRTDCAADCSWDGMVKGQPAAQGVYLFTARVQYLDGVEELLSGAMQIIW